MKNDKRISIRRREDKALVLRTVAVVLNNAIKSNKLSRMTAKLIEDDFEEQINNQEEKI